MNWKRINRKRLPKTGQIVTGSYRNGEWTTSSVGSKGFESWFDSDRTHYVRLPKRPKH